MCLLNNQAYLMFPISMLNRCYWLPSLKWTSRKWYYFFVSNPTQIFTAIYWNRNYVLQKPALKERSKYIDWDEKNYTNFNLENAWIKITERVTCISWFIVRFWDDNIFNLRYNNDNWKLSCKRPSWVCIFTFDHKITKLGIGSCEVLV